MSSLSSQVLLGSQDIAGLWLNCQILSGLGPVRQDWRAAGQDFHYPLEQGVESGRDGAPGWLGR